MPFLQIRFGTITATPEYSFTDFLPAYEWLEQEIGFYPHFLAAGDIETIMYRTGYDDNWRVFDHGEFTGTGYRKIFRKKGEFPNNVLFSFDDLDGVFMDELSWNIAINARINGETVSKQDRSMILKPSWNRSRWIHAAKQKSAWVCLLTPELPLAAASWIFVRNLATKKALETEGFRNVRNLRIPVEKMPV